MKCILSFSSATFNNSFFGCEAPRSSVGGEKHNLSFSFHCVFQDTGFLFYPLLLFYTMRSEDAPRVPVRSGAEEGPQPRRSFHITVIWPIRTVTGIYFTSDLDVETHSSRSFLHRLKKIIIQGQSKPLTLCIWVTPLLEKYLPPFFFPTLSQRRICIELTSQKTH